MLLNLDDLYLICRSWRSRRMWHNSRPSRAIRIFTDPLASLGLTEAMEGSKLALMKAIVAAVDRLMNLLTSTQRCN